MRRKANDILAGLAATVVGVGLLLGGCGGNAQPADSGEAAAESGAASSGSAPEETDALLNEDVQNKVNNIKGLIDQYFLFEEDEENMEEGIYAGILAGLDDPYSVYYTREEYDQLMEDTSGSYCGIGAMVTQDPNTGMISVVKVFAGTPSEEAGLLPEDVIVAVDGTEVTGMDLDLVVSQHVRGEEGTEVVLTVLRPSTGGYLDLSLTRRVVETPTVEGQLLEGQIGYVAVSQFDLLTSGQFAAAIDELEEQGMAGLIVDLRGNPGGTLDAVVKMLDYILPDDLSNYARGGDATTLIYTEDKKGDGDSYSASDGHSVDVPMAVLINGNSASASEVFAGALKDYGWATLVGTTSFGKGIVQSIFPLGDGTAIKLTVSNYYTPSGLNIHGVGIEPDVEVALAPELATKASISPEEDNQLQTAIEILTTGEGLVPHQAVKPAQTEAQTDGQPACSGMGHMEAQYEPLTEAVFEALAERGYVSPYRVDYHLDEVESGSGERRYHISEYQLVESGQEYNGYDLLSVDYDLGSGQLHSLTLQLSDEAAAEEAACAVVSVLGEAAGLQIEEADLAELRKQMEALEEGSSFTLDTDAFSAQIGILNEVVMAFFEPAG